MAFEVFMQALLKIPPDLFELGESRAGSSGVFR